MIPILIGGMGRSGTTIIKNTLANHSRVMGTGELRWLADPRGLFHMGAVLSGIGSPPIVDRMWKEFKQLLFEPEFRATFLDLFGEEYATEALKKLENALFDVHTGSKYHGWIDGPFHEMFYSQKREVWYAIRMFVSQLMYRKAKNDGIQPIYWVEDTPENAWWFDIATNPFRAVCYHAIRHPYDIVSGIRKRQLARPPETAWWWPIEVEDIAKRIHNLWLATRDSPATNIRLEWLVDDPASIFNEILDDLDLEWEDKLLRWIDSKQHHKDRWKKELTTKEVRIIAPILKPVMEDWGYEAS